MHNITISTEPVGARYAELLRFGATVCNSIQMVVQHGLGTQEIELLAQLEPWRSARNCSNRWPGTTLLKGTAELHIFVFEPSSIDVILTHTDRLFQWLQPEFPEDPSLLRPNGTPWLTTISHERDGYLSMDDRELRDLQRLHPELAALLSDQ